MRLVTTTAAVFVSALALASSGSAAHAAPNQSTTNRESSTVIVQRGDSLSKIAKAEDTTYPRLFYANPGVEHPDVVYAGSELRVPTPDEELVERPLPGAAVASTPAPAPQPVYAATTAAPQYAAPQHTTYNPTPAQAAPAAGGDTWDQLAACESGGNWSTNTGNGYSGGLQFSQSSWEGVGGTGLASQASKAEQIARAEQLQAKQGWGAWPACSAKLGIR